MHAIGQPSVLKRPRILLASPRENCFSCLLASQLSSARASPPLLLRSGFNSRALRERESLSSGASSIYIRNFLRLSIVRVDIYTYVVRRRRVARDAHVNAPRPLACVSLLLPVLSARFPPPRLPSAVLALRDRRSSNRTRFV